MLTWLKKVEHKTYKFFSNTKMDKDILMLLKLKKINFTTIRLFFGRCRYWKSISVKQDFFSETISTLSVTCIMIIKLNH